MRQHERAHGMAPTGRGGWETGQRLLAGILPGVCVWERPRRDGGALLQLGVGAPVQAVLASAAPTEPGAPSGWFPSPTGTNALSPTRGAP